LQVTVVAASCARATPVVAAKTAAHATTIPICSLRIVPPGEVPNLHFAPTDSKLVHGH
jgi:hypothetical protein